MLQLSVVQALLSLQLTAVCWQPAVGSHVSVVQALASSQFMAVPGMHVEFTHVSTPLQTLRSSHCEFVVQQFGTPVCAHRCVVVLQVSFVHVLPSSHCEARLQQPGTGLCTH